MGRFRGVIQEVRDDAQGVVVEPFEPCAQILTEWGEEAEEFRQAIRQCPHQNRAPIRFDAVASDPALFGKAVNDAGRRRGAERQHPREFADGHGAVAMHQVEALQVDGTHPDLSAEVMPEDRELKLQLSKPIQHSPGLGVALVDVGRGFGHALILAGATRRRSRSSEIISLFVISGYRYIMDNTFDGRAAVTRSMLGWGVVAGPFYLGFGLILALTRTGFDLSRHALSLLTLGEGGWLQITNFALTGIMVVVSGWGLLRAIEGRGRGAGSAVIVAGVAIVLAGVFRPDPVAGFPAGAEATVSVSGILHLVAGALEFVAFAIAALLLARFFASRGERGRAAWSRIAGVTIVVGFVAGAALSAGPAGVALLWLAVITAFAWLLTASVWIYRIVPHPDA